MAKRLTYEQTMGLKDDGRKMDFCPYVRSPSMDKDGRITGLCALLHFKPCVGNPFQTVNEQNFAEYRCDIAKRLYEKEEYEK